jgi:hypothetical protein
LFGEFVALLGAGLVSVHIAEFVALLDATGQLCVCRICQPKFCMKFLQLNILM